MPHILRTGHINGEMPDEDLAGRTGVLFMKICEFFGAVISVCGHYFLFIRCYTSGLGLHGTSYQYQLQTFKTCLTHLNMFSHFSATKDLSNVSVCAQTCQDITSEFSVGMNQIHTRTSY